MKEEELVKLLLIHKLHITTAESCTAGLLSSTIVNVSGSSSVFDMAFVTYANYAKEKLINVSGDTISKYGVVSEEVVYEMAIGAARKANAEAAISISGVAGPNGGTDRKPVGMVCFGFYLNGIVKTYTMKFGSIGRMNVRSGAVEFAIDKMIEIIKECYHD